MNTDNDGFTTKRVTELTGVSLIQLDNWRRWDVLKPSLGPARRRGAPLLYTFGEMVAAGALRGLQLAGMSQSSLRVVAAYICNRDGISPTERLSLSTLITDGHDVEELRGDFTNSSLFNSGLSFGVVRLDQLVSKIQERAALPAQAA